MTTFIFIGLADSYYGMILDCDVCAKIKPVPSAVLVVEVLSAVVVIALSFVVVVIFEVVVVVVGVVVVVVVVVGVVVVVAVVSSPLHSAGSIPLNMG